MIVGAGAFPLTEHLQRPYCRRNMEEREMVYNYRLSRARRVSENAAPPTQEVVQHTAGQDDISGDVRVQLHVAQLLASAVQQGLHPRRVGDQRARGPNSCLQPSANLPGVGPKKNQRGQTNAGDVGRLFYGVSWQDKMFT